MFFNKAQDESEIDYDGFFDGQNKTIPDNTELNMAVTGGFEGIEDGKALRVCFVNFIITTEGEFFGQKYKFNAKVFDNDAAVRDRARQNLGVLDAQAGFPMTIKEIEPTTESIEQYWVGASEARVKFGMFVSTENADGSPKLDADGGPIAEEINFVRGFGYLREKMIKAGGDSVVHGEPAQQAKSVEDEFNEPDIDFD